MKKFVTICLILITGCEENVINLPSGESRLVVEGWLTNEFKSHQIRLSRTVPFDAAGDGEPIEEALVVIREINGPIYACTYQGQGIYTSDVFSGSVGRSYRLEVQLPDGRTIRSEDESLVFLEPIQQLDFQRFDGTDPVTNEPVEQFYPLITSSDPENEENFYRYIGFRNDKRFNEPEQLVLLSDRFINGADSFVNELQSFTYIEGDSARVDLLSISASAYAFLRLFRSQTESLGSTAGVGPANLVGNLFVPDEPEEEVLGYFGVSAISTISGRVE